MKIKVTIEAEEQEPCIYCKHCKVRTPWYGAAAVLTSTCDIQIPTWLHNEKRLAWNRGVRRKIRKMIL